MAYEVQLGEPAENAVIVSLELAKKNSVIETDYEDDLLQLYLESASAEIENYIGAPILLREESKFTIDKWFKSFHPSERLDAITKVSYRDEDDNEVILTETQDYFLNKSTNTLVLNIVDQPEGLTFPITVEANVGYTKAPADIQRAALLIFSNAETYRENAPIKMETAAKALLRPYRNY